MTPAPLPRAVVRRIACAVVAAEMHRLRKTGLPPAHPDDWPDTLPIGEDGLGLDSLERMGALGALAETFDLDDALLDREPPRTVGAWIDLAAGGRASTGGRLAVTTSGSTGSPKSCVHAVADLLGEAAFLASRLPGRRRVVALVPAHHLYGIIWTALLPAALNVPVVPRTLGAPLGLAAGDLVVAVPEQWQAMARLTRRLPPDIVGVSSAGSLDDQTGAALLFSGLARLIDIYGSSETGGVAMRDLPATAYTLLPRWRLVPQDDHDWQLSDDHGGRHDLPDHVERIGEHGLRLIGRRDGAVQVGGHNVWPGRVAAMLRSIEGVADAAVRLDANGRLKTYIVAHPNHDTTELSVRIERAMAEQLTGPERPKSLRFGPALPRNMMGKLEDWS